MQKLFRCACAVVLCCALQLAGFSAPPQKIAGVSPSFSQELAYFMLDGSLVEAETLQSLQVYPGSELIVYLAPANVDTALFVDQDGDPIVTPDVTMSRLRAGRVSVELRQQDERLIESVSFVYHRAEAQVPVSCAAVKIQFAPYFVSVEDTPFSSVFYLALDGNVQEQTALPLQGVMCTSPLYVTKEDEVAVLENGYTAVALEAIPTIELELGQGLSVHTSMYAGQKCYGVANTSVSPADDALFAQYTGLQQVYTLQTVNLHPEGNSVTIQSGQMLYVYNSEGHLIGTTEDILPFSSKYYVSEQPYSELMINRE